MSFVTLFTIDRRKEQFTTLLSNTPNENLMLSPYLYKSIHTKRRNRLIKNVSIVLSCIVISLATFACITTVMLSQPVKNRIATGIAYVLPADETLIRPIPTDIGQPESSERIVESVSVEKETPDSYRYTITSGDNRWKLTKRAINEYVSDNNLSYTEREKNHAVSLIIAEHEGETLKVGTSFEIPVSEIQIALDTN